MITPVLSTTVRLQSIGCRWLGRRGKAFPIGRREQFGVVHCLTHRTLEFSAVSVTFLDNRAAAE